MALSVRTVPNNFPAGLGHRLLKAEALRQMSILHQEIVTELLSLLTDTREPIARNRLVRIIEGHLRAGLTTAEKAANGWPTTEEASQEIEKHADGKPAAAKKHLRTFAQLDRLHSRSLALLESSFENVGVILKRVQPLAASETTPAPKDRPA